MERTEPTEGDRFVTVESAEVTVDRRALRTARSLRTRHYLVRRGERYLIALPPVAGLGEVWGAPHATVVVSARTKCEFAGEDYRRTDRTLSTDVVEIDGWASGPSTGVVLCSEGEVYDQLPEGEAWEFPDDLSPHVGCAPTVVEWPHSEDFLSRLSLPGNARREDVLEQSLAGVRP